MIGRIQGQLVEKHPPQLLIDVNGLGYEIEAPMSTFYTLPDAGKAVTLHTHLAVREDAFTLYGFSTLEERALFRALIRISGVGGKLALTILSGISVNEFMATIQANDSERLTQLPGVGKKTAARLVIEMRDQLGKEPVAISISSEHGTDAVNNPASEAHSALVALGYKPAEATRLLSKVSKNAQDAEELIRMALQQAVK